ncbi:GntR family transcriptional regulator [Litoreibacter janthinus]|uniref:Transcriptional regulator, GntR family n=1 Tax=Litoreibacter janthinus TaxID=670154 RepID=A0A1I6GWI1_9RHOB|nr:GntR family transcriptional regulator [Litoreibacter janthinus]SFR46623.1 transcriptional regulator, GntR family [Litoreibacter janthinus]
MKDTEKPPEHLSHLPLIRQSTAPTVADQIFSALQTRILTLELPPRTKISETEVAKAMGVSRQPVREAFKRLAKLGFLTIRPQSRTTVSLISEEAVTRARFIRMALETQTCRTASEGLSEAGLTALSNLIEQQKVAIAAGDRMQFHTLDDQFHKEICVQSGVGYVWDLIHENKAHMDRIRMLSLDTSSQHFALEEHIEMYEAISSCNGEAAAAAVTKHLSRILQLIETIKQENHNWFTDISE